jgi:hypothetical protein
MMKRVVLLLAVTLASLAVPTWGQVFLHSPEKTKIKVIHKPCDTVFAAAEKLASEKPYKLDLDAKTEKKLVISGSFWKGRQQMTVNFYQTNPEECSVTADSFYSGVLRNGTVFLNRLEKAVQ